MTELFLSVFNRGIEAGCLICAVICARFLMKKTPKKIICILWLAVGVRLLCPFHLESEFSLLPKGQIGIQNTKDVLTGGKTLADAADSDTGHGELSENLTNEKGFHHELNNKESAGSKTSAAFLAGAWPRVINAAAYIWLAGIICFSAYMASSWHFMKRRTAQAVPAEFEGTVFYQCGGIQTPFLFGMLSPKIYVPFSVSGQELFYVLKHETAHKSRRDNWTKPAGYLLAVCYWFHPLVWAAYILFCRDLEMACDEKVISELGSGCKKEYSRALLACSVKKNQVIAACPVAFGEIGVKKRVKNILKFKKASFGTLFAASVISLLIIVCFATRPGSGAVQNAEPGAENSEARTGSRTSSEAYTGGEAPAGSAASSKTHAQNSKNHTGNGNARTADRTTTKTQTDSHTMADREELSDIMKNVLKWAEVFCSRDGTEAEKMLTEEMRVKLMDGRSFGWSSPWPWESGVMGEEPNYRIVSADSRTAVILYYAWTSDPHVTVWQQTITYSGRTDGFLIDGMSMEYFDEIATAEEFYKAYPDGVIKNTRMDYISNGTYEALNQNALLSSTDIYRTLSKPDTAAVYLLNLASQADTDCTERGGHMIVTVTFEKDHSLAEVEMVQPDGENGIWIPRTDAKR